MPYRIPGVYIEERGFLPPTIERAPTSGTAFIGPTVKGLFMGMVLALPSRSPPTLRSSARMGCGPTVA